MEEYTSTFIYIYIICNLGTSVEHSRFKKNENRQRKWERLEEVKSWIVEKLCNEKERVSMLFSIWVLVKLEIRFTSVNYDWMIEIKRVCILKN